MRHLRSTLRVLALLALALPTAASAASTSTPSGPELARGLMLERHAEHVAFLDVRTALVPRTARAAVQRARAQLARRLGRFAVVDADRTTGTARFVARLDGFLSGPRRGAPAAIALAWVRAHSTVVGLAPWQLSHLRLAHSYRSPDGVTHLIWQQSVAGIPVFGADLRAAVAADGRIVSVGGGPVARLPRTPGTAALSAGAALRAVLESVQARLVAPRLLGSTGTDELTSFADGSHASLVLFDAGNGARLAWRVWAVADSRHVYDAVVDARDARLLWRTNRVESANGLAWDFYPGAPAGGEALARDFGQWLTASDHLESNSAHAFQDADDDDQPDPVTGEVGPSSGSDWLNPYTPIPSPAGNCPAAGCTWNHAVPFSWRVNASQNTQQVFYFLNHYSDHLAAPPISFTEAAGNFRMHNASGEGKDGDPVKANALDGADFLPADVLRHADNANMLTPPDGQSPRMQMYLFEPLPGVVFGGDADGDGLGDGYPFADINGGDDASVIYHEYTHGLSNRLVVDASGTGALDAAQSGAMGEAWSDWYAFDFLEEQGFVNDTDAPGELHEGEFTDGGNNLIRTEPIDCPVGAPAPACPRKWADPASGHGGYTYADFGKIAGGPEVHADGEIWGQTLWELRSALIASLGHDRGLHRAEAIVTRGMSLSVANPSYLDMRNTILQADALGYGKADWPVIWDVFARRGMGYYAAAVDGADTHPVADSSMPPGAAVGTGSINGTAQDTTGQPLAGIPVYVVGHLGGPGQLATKTGPLGNWRINGIPAGDYGGVRVGGHGWDIKNLAPFSLQPGQTVKLDTVQLARDWSALSGGAQITRVDATETGCNAPLALDQDQASGMEFFSPYTSREQPTGTKSFTIELPQTIDVTGFDINPGPGCNDDSSSQIKDMTVETSPDGTAWTTAASPAFTSSQANRLVHFAPTAGSAGVRFVRVTLVDPIGPQTPDGGAVFTGGEWMDLAEMMVRGTPAG